MPRPKKPNRADKRFEIKRTVGKDADGKSVRKSFYGSNEAEALRAYQSFLEDQKREQQERAYTPFPKWAEKWLYTYKEPDVKANTFLTTYKRPCERYIIPYFKDSILQELRQADLKAFLNSLAGSLSQSYLDKITICLRSIFECAVDNELVNRNPCKNVSVKSRIEQEKKRTYDLETAEALCRSDHKYALYIHILLKMGLRCSELCGLKWEDIDLESAKMSISRALTTESGVIYIGPPKSANSVRKLDIPADLLARLKQAKAEYDSAPPKSVGRYDTTGYIATLNGHHITPDHFGDRQLEAFYNYHKIPNDCKLSPHELRHTCGTLLYQSTKDVYFVSRYLGHSDIGITTKTYVHSEMQDTAVRITFTETGKKSPSFITVTE
jgi:integrase